MKINSQQKSDDHQVHFTVEIEPETLASARQKAARKIAQRVKIPGFRPGKAPFNVVEKQVGAQAIKDEALDIVLDEVYPKVIEEAGIKPYGPGMLEKVNEDKEPPVFEFSVPLSPEVKLGDYKKIRLPFKEKLVKEADIDNVIINLREQNAVLSPVQRAVEEGDIAYILLGANRQKPDKDGKVELLAERRYPVVIEKADIDTKSEWPFPGFSRVLIGMKPGEERSFPHTFAKDSEFEDLRGETADFKLKIEEIKDRQLPDLDDAFAQSLGTYKTVAELRADVEKQLKENYESEQKNDYEDSVVEKIIEGSEIKFPPQMLHHEIHHYIEDMGPDLTARGLDLDTYLKSRQIDLETLEKEVEPAVEKRLKKSLVVMEVAKQEKIEVADGEVQGLVENKVKQLQQVVAEQDLRKLLNKENLQGLANRTITEEVIRRTLARLDDIAQGKDLIEKKETKGEEKNEEQPA